MSAITANGARFNVQKLEAQPPHAPTVVFMHGLVMDNLSSFYYTLAGPFADMGARVILYDLRGHGMSERTPRGYTTSDGAADLCGVLDAIGVTEPVYLVGNSYGGLLAARTAVLAPERVAGLVMIEANCTGPGAAAWIEDMLNTLTVAALSLEYERTADKLLAAGQRKLARVARAADMLLNDTSLIQDLSTERALDITELEKIRCPVLGVYGGQSGLADGAAELRRHVRRSQVEIIPGLAHTVLRDATGTLRGIVTDWLPRAEAELSGALPRRAEGTA
jgi:pimeloyl-ACP methyl ester carboxylesterase